MNKCSHDGSEQRNQRALCLCLRGVIVALAIMVIGPSASRAYGQDGFVASGGGQQGYVEPASYESRAAVDASSTNDSNWIRANNARPGDTGGRLPPAVGAEQESLNSHVSVLRQATSTATLTPKTKTRLVPPSSEGTSEPKRNGSSFVSVVASLLLVVGLFLACSLGYRKWIAPSGVAGAHGEPRVLSRTHIGPRQQLAVVEFGPKLVLVSLHQGQMRTLSELTEADDIAAFHDGMDSKSDSDRKASDRGSRHRRIHAARAPTNWRSREQQLESEPSVALSGAKGVVAR